MPNTKQPEQNKTISEGERVKECKKYWADKHNELPIEFRTIISANEAITRIQHLNFEKDRLKKRYLQSIKEINSHIENCEKWVIDLTPKNEQTK